MSRILGVCLLLAAVMFFPGTTEATCQDTGGLCMSESPSNCTSNGACAPGYGYSGTCTCAIYAPKTSCSCN